MNDSPHPDYELLYAIEDLRWAAEGEFGAHITPARARTLLAQLGAPHSRETLFIRPAEDVESRIRAILLEAGLPIDDRRIAIVSVASSCE